MPLTTRLPSQSRRDKIPNRRYPKRGRGGGDDVIVEIDIALLEKSLKIADNNGSGSGLIDLISLEATAEEYVMS